MRMQFVSRVALAILTSATFACRDNPASPDVDADARAYNPDWTRRSHGRTDPQYAAVFPQESVNTIEIRMTGGQWASIRSNMKEIWGFDFNEGLEPGPGPAPDPSPDPGPAPGPDPFPSDLSRPDPDFVHVRFTHEGRQWMHVGFRLKGNSSLGAAWSRGVYKLPFRLDFDEFEDDFPIQDQRFFGFKQLAFTPGTNDFSLLREKVASDVLRLAGIPAARTAFYRVYIDFGEGLKYCGLYTAVEVIDDTMVEDQFGDDHGNIYKPESRLATFDPLEFHKKNNQGSGDYSDVEAFVAALNSPLRSTDPSRWRAALEATFDVDHFLRWLAVNNAMVNWDSYGTIAHNYYLFDHPTRQLVWIPWDHDLSLEGNPGATGPTEPGPGPALGLSLAMNEVTDRWPLLRYLADDPVYYARYRGYLRQFVSSTFTEATMDAMLDRYHALIAPHVVGAQGEQPGYSHLPTPDAFTTALAELKTHVRNRRAVVREFVP